MTQSRAQAPNTATQSAANAAVRGGGGLRRNFVAMLLWQIGNYLVPLVTFPYLARVLGPAQFGVVGFATALAVYGTILTEWGFNLSGPRTTAQWRHDRDKLGELVWSIIGAKSCFCLLSAALLAAFLPFAPDMAGLRPLVWIGWIGVAANVITLNWLLLGMERFTLFAGIAVASRFATLPLTFWLVRSPNDVVCVVAIQAGAALIAAAGSLIVAHRNGWLCWPRFSWPAVRSQICDSADMFVSTASVSLFGATNAVILGGFAGPYQIDCTRRRTNSKRSATWCLRRSTPCSTRVSPRCSTRGKRKGRGRPHG